MHLSFDIGSGKFQGRGLPVEAYTSACNATPPTLQPATQPLMDRASNRHEGRGWQHKQQHKWTHSMTHMLALFQELFAHLPPLVFDLRQKSPPVSSTQMPVSAKPVMAWASSSLTRRRSSALCATHPAPRG